MIGEETTKIAPFRKRFPAEYFVKFNSAGIFPASSCYEACLLLDAFEHVHKIFGTFMEDNVTILKMGANMH